MKSIIVTGAGGFIGAEICRQLVTNGNNVIAIVSPFSTSGRLNSISTKVEILKINLVDEEKVENLIKRFKPYAVLHLATHGVYTYQQEDDSRIVNDNFLMTSHLLKYSAIYKVDKFVNTGSVFEYGSQRKKVTEVDTNLTDILNKYSAIKLATTALTNSYSTSMKVITLRPFTTYGVLEDSTRFVISTIKRALGNEPIRIVKDVIRDFVNVEDVAAAYLLTLETDFPSGTILNIASGIKYTLESISRLIKKLTLSNSEIMFDDTYKRSKESACWANIDNAKMILKWYPKLTMLQGIKKMVYCLQNAN